jgi:pSer/pThr/pTyr-binding forkhead associated (FHA) protein
LTPARPLECWLLALCCAGPRTGARRALRLGAEACTLGRAEEAALRLPDANLSPLHARVARDGQGLAVQDLGSRQGTRLNGRRLEPGRSVPLRAGDELRLGAHRVVVWCGPPEARPDGRALAEAVVGRLLSTGQAAQGGELWLRGARGLALRLEQGRVYRVGRGAGCDLRLADRRVSRVHAVLRPGARDCQVDDPGATNGLRLEGRPLAGPARLEPGQALEVGDARLELALEPGGGSPWSEPLGPPARLARSRSRRAGLALLALLAGGWSAALWLVW